MSLTATSSPSTPETNTSGTSNRVLSLSELNDATLADESSMTDTQRRIARRRVLEARARATMAELDTLTKSFQHLSPSSLSALSAPVTPVRSAAAAAAYSSTPLGTSSSASSSTASTSVTSAAAAATAAVRVRDVLLLSRNGHKQPNKSIHLTVVVFRNSVKW